MAVFTFTAADAPDAIDFDMAATVCEGVEVDLANFVFSDGDVSFSVNGTAIDGSTFTPTAADADESGNIVVMAMIDAGDCGSVQDSEVVGLIAEAATAAVESYGFECQSADDFSIDLTQYIDDGNTGANMNGGQFTMGAVPAFISELEYNSSNSSNDFVEITAAQGTDLSNYALFFYMRDGGVASGHMYYAYQLEGTIGDSFSDDVIPTEALNTLTLDANENCIEGPNNFDIISSGAADLQTASNGISYGAIAYESGLDIMSGAAAIALVWIGDETLCEQNYFDNNDVVQFIGYGPDQANTNDGIFTSCAGPAAGMIPVDINLVDDTDATTTLQFTNACWQLADMTDEPLDYDSTPFSGSENDDTNSAGDMNWGLIEAGADELYFDYIAPDGDILALDRLCRSLFTTSQTEGVDETDGVDDDGTSDDDTQPTDPTDSEGADDEGSVYFTCCVPTYTVPFGYATFNQCGVSAPATFNLTILMDLHAEWDAPKDNICDNEVLNLTELISDTVQFIAPIKREGSYTASTSTTFDEVIPPPAITEIHYEYYNYDGAATDNHCVAYNYVDNAGTPFDAVDDSYETAYICEGIEISAPVNTDLSCYQLVIYEENDIDPDSPSNALGADVAYINADGELVETDISEGIYMDLYGTVSVDAVPAGYDNTTVILAPDFGYYSFETAPELNGYPFYAGYDPLTNPYGNAPAAAGLYLDADGNAGDDAYETGETATTATDFPWEWSIDPINDCLKTGVGARWFPILNMPDNIGGIGMLNKCTGEFIEFISYGGKLCVENKEDFSLAGPFEQMMSNPIDTVQSDVLGDLRSVQLISCSEYGLTGADCEACAEEDATVWAIVFNGGAISIPGCGEVGSVDEFDFSNTFGAYNCGLSEDHVTFDTDGFSLNIDDPENPFGIDQDGNEVDADFSGILPEDAIITGHTVTVYFGTGSTSDVQIFQYSVNSGNCADTWDTWGQTDEAPCLIGDLNFEDPTEQGYICGDCGDNIQGCINGENIGIADAIAAGGDGDGYYDATYDNQNECYIGYCASKAQDIYTVSDLAAYIYDGNHVADATESDTCRMINDPAIEYDVYIEVSVDWIRCLPVGNFSANTPGYDSPVSLNEDDIENPYMQFDATGLAANFDEIEVTYDATNAHPIEADDVTDDLYCEDLYTKEVHLLPSAAVSLTEPTTSYCPGDLVDLMSFAMGAGAGVWTGEGVTGSTFSSNTAGTYELTYTVGGGTDCDGFASIMVTVDAAEQIAASDVSVECSADGSTYTVSFNLAGGSGTYTVNGAAAGASYTSAPIANGSTYSFTVAGTGCDLGVTVTDTPEPCATCGAEAGSFALNPSLANAGAFEFVYCGDNDQLSVMTGSQTGEADGHELVYVLTDAAGTVVALSADGDFGDAGSVSTGTYDYLVWALSYADGQVDLPGVGDSAVGFGDDTDCADLSDPIAVVILNDINIDLEVVCEPSEADGYLIQVTITGGLPEYGATVADPGFVSQYELGGAYMTVDGADVVSYDTPTLVANADGSGFDNDGTFIGITVESDGNLCDGNASIQLPDASEAPCTASTVDANDDISTGNPGEEIPIDIIDNDTTGEDPCAAEVVPSSLMLVSTTCDNDAATFSVDAAGNFSFTSPVECAGTIWEFTYMIEDCEGNTDMANITVTVGGETGLDLAAVGSTTCSASEFFGEVPEGSIGVIVSFSGGTAPYFVTGDFSDEFDAPGAFGQIVAEGESPVFVVTDDNGDSVEVTFDDLTPCSKLAVELIAFDGTVEAPGNDLNWVSASETDNDYYTLQHSTDGINFATITTVEGFGEGTSVATLAYNFLHTDAPVGVSYYRLLATDLDGATTVQGDLTLTREADVFGIVNVAPVPASDILNVNFTTPADATVNLTVYNVAGKLIANNKLQTVAGANQTTIDVSTYPAGTYYISINDGAAVVNTKFIVE